jgi:hypothetical protein
VAQIMKMLPEQTDRLNGFVPAGGQLEVASPQRPTFRP